MASDAKEAPASPLVRICADGMATVAGNAAGLETPAGPCTAVEDGTVIRSAGCGVSGLSTPPVCEGTPDGICEPDFPGTVTLGLIPASTAGWSGSRLSSELATGFWLFN